MTKKRMSGMSLSSFGGLQRSQPDPEPAPPEVKEAVEEAPPVDNADSPEPTKASPKPKAKRKRKETLTTVNIKIERKQQRWLQDTAQLVRDNNDEPVLPSDRVYPQHLIGMAVDLLKAQDIDWDTIKSVDDLRKALNL